jgi:predicted metal-dependent hydrolase
VNREQAVRQTGRPPQQAETGLVTGEGIVVPYRVVRSARRRRTLELRLERDGVRVAAPVRTSSAEIAAFVRSRIPWIRRHREASTDRRPAPLRCETGEALPYLGRMLPLEILPGDGRQVRVRLDLLGLRVHTPHLPDGNHADRVQAALRTWYRERAVEEITARVQAWSDRAGYAPRAVLVRDQKRRWGSCSRNGTLRFNWRLGMLDPSILDYVVVHEIAHLRHPHHQPEFWAEVARLIPDHRERRRALREAGRLLPL